MEVLQEEEEVKVTELLKPSQLHDYQKQCVLHQLYNDDSMLWLQMGLGKTPITLTTIVDRMRAGQVKKVLIFGPLRVIQAVWAREARKWEHTKHLRFSIVHGTKEKRLRALFTEADIYLINYENMNWLADTLVHYYLSQEKPLPFEMVVYDEVSKLKSSTALRMAGGKRDRKDKRGERYEIKVTGWRKILDHFKYRTGLTGTPAANGYLDLHGQYLAVDGGKRLGEYITRYKDSYFASDYMGWSYSPTEIGKKWIEHVISDITIKMDAKDYLDMPETKIVNMMVDLPESVRKAYKDIEMELFTRLESGSEVEVFSKSSVSNKCLQFCNGSPYLSSESPEYEAIHDAKLDALEEILEEAGGSPVLCSYSFKSDAERIMSKFKKYRPVNMTTAKSKDTEKIINDWNAGKIPLLIGHPACLGADTLVLTERGGWVKIIDVRTDDRVHDGVEFVDHAGCHFSGVRPVVDVFGMTMTPDHKLLIKDKWMEARNVEDSEEARTEARFEWEVERDSNSRVPELRVTAGDDAPECNEAQCTEPNSLSELHCGEVSQHDRDSDIPDMVRHEGSCERCPRQRLRRSWHYIVQKVGIVRELLRGYVSRVCRRSDNRTNKCKWKLLQGKLQVGDRIRSTVEQAKQSCCNLSRRTNAPCRIVSQKWIQQNHADDEIESWNDGGRGCTGCDEFSLREEYRKKEHEAKRTQAVYDLVNCGPRHRFLIRNSEGEVFISHNSMGHGVDGLQESGSIMVWFGMNWSLELYEQMNARLDRQGQKKPVSIIRILCRDTVDLAVADAIERKTDDQDGLKAALQRYKDGVTTNDLEVNFF